MIKQCKVLFAILCLSIIFILPVKSQPIPVELMLGHNYGVIDLSFSKNFTQTSRFGFFHMNTVEFNYTDEARNSFILQDVVYAEIVDNVRIAIGAAYSKGGFSPTVGVQYIYSGEKLIFLCAPRINIENTPSYNIITILQYKPDINDRVKLFTRFKMLNLFDTGGNIKSYQWLRLGLEMKGIQFGMAANFDEYGPSPSVNTNVGMFVRKEIF